MDSQDLRNLTEAWQNIVEYTRESDKQGLTPAQIKAQQAAAAAEARKRGMNAASSYQQKSASYKPAVPLSAIGDFLKSMVTGPAGGETYRTRLGIGPEPKPTQTSKVPPNRESSTDTTQPVRSGSPVRSAPVVSPQQAARNKANAEYQALRTKDPAAAKEKGMEIWKAKYKDTLAKKVSSTGQQLGTGQSQMAKQAAELRALRPVQPAAPVVAATAPIANRTAMAYGSGATPVTPIRPIVPVARPVAQTPVARPITPIAYRPGLRLQHTDLFDIVKGHLMNEGATEKEALKRMVNMTEEERQDIIEAKYGTKEGRKKLAKKIRKGEEIGKSGPGTGFAAVEKAAKEGGARDPKAVAAAVMWKTHGGKK